MSIEKMRRDFDLWHLNRFTDHVLAEEIQAATLWMGSKEIIWIGWQASRAALVIELPQQSGVNLDWNQAIRYCHQAIEAVGVKVKP